jgi:hypothetical protein
MLREWVVAMEIIESMLFVLRSVRASVGGTLRHGTVAALPPDLVHRPGIHRRVSVVSDSTRVSFSGLRT